MNRRLFLSLGVLTFAAVAAYIGGTGALYTDTYASQNNVFTSDGVTINMSPVEHLYRGPGGPEVDPTGFDNDLGDDNNPSRFEFADLKPLDWGELRFTIENLQNEAYVCALVSGDVPAPGPDFELYDRLQFYAGSNQMTFGQWVDLGVVGEDDTTQYSVDYCFGVPTVTSNGIQHCGHGGLNYNPAQGGSFSADILLFAVQARSNEGFSCDKVFFNDVTDEWEVEVDYLPQNPVVYFQGFEDDQQTEDEINWFPWPTDTSALDTSVPSGTGGVTAASGNFFATISSTGGAFTRWGGYASEFPVGGYTTELDVYLDMDRADGVATERFDFSSAINNADNPPAHRRDFIFHVGVQIGETDKWFASVSNNAHATEFRHIMPSLDPVEITATGWYTLQSHFYDAGGGVLAVDKKIIDSNGVVVGSWTRSTPADIIGDTVGGNRYGWFLNNNFDDLPFDNALLYIGAPSI